MKLNTWCRSLVSIHQLCRKYFREANGIPEEFWIFFFRPGYLRKQTNIKLFPLDYGLRPEQFLILIFMNIEADMMVTAQYGSQNRQYVLASVRLWSFNGGVKIIYYWILWIDMDGADKNWTWLFEESAQMILEVENWHWKSDFGNFKGTTSFPK